MVNIPSILVIDSGVGGLSICQSIMSTSEANEQNLQIIYFADDAFSPYGLLEELELEKRLESIVSSMLVLHQPDLVILACNTVSTLLLPQLRAQFDVPFVGVVPAIKPAAKKTLTNRIGLLATPATVCRAYTDALISDYAAECEVIRVGSNELVTQAEALLAGEKISLNVIETVLEPFISEDIALEVDTIVLGCTHFPLLKQQLQEVLPNVSWVDSGEAIAKRVHDLLGQMSHGHTHSSDASLVHQIYFSESLPDQFTFKSALAELGIKDSKLHLLNIS